MIPAPPKTCVCGDAHRGIGRERLRVGAEQAGVLARVDGRGRPPDQPEQRPDGDMVAWIVEASPAQPHDSSSEISALVTASAPPPP